MGSVKFLNQTHYNRVAVALIIIIMVLVCLLFSLLMYLICKLFYSYQLPDKSIASLVRFYYSWKKTRSKTSVMDRHARKQKRDREERLAWHEYIHRMLVSTVFNRVICSVIKIDIKDELWCIFRIQVKYKMSFTFFSTSDEEAEENNCTSPADAECEPNKEEKKEVI